MRQTVTETGKVREIKGNMVIVAPNMSAACFGCMNQECKAGGGLITAENSGALSLETGQMVEVSAPGVSLLAQALLSLLPPIMGFMTGYTLTRLLFPGAGEGAFAGAGVILLFAAAFIVYKARAKFPAKRVYRVTRLVNHLMII